MSNNIKGKSSPLLLFLVIAIFIHLFKVSEAEAQISAPISPSPVKLGDANGDNKVDIQDYNIVLSDFGKKNDPNAKGDLDNDDDVDIFDYTIILGQFGK